MLPSSLSPRPLHLALRFAPLVHQWDSTQPLETADSRRQCRSPRWWVGRGWGRVQQEIPECQPAISAEPLFRSRYSPCASAILDLCVSGENWGLKKMFKAWWWAPGLGSLPLPERVRFFCQSLLFSFKCTCHLPSPETVALPSSSSQVSSLCLCRVVLYLVLCINLHIYLFTCTFIFSTICILYMCVLYVFTRRACIYITKVKSMHCVLKAFFFLSVRFHVHTLM